jgi:hypothetical protein
MKLPHKDIDAFLRKQGWDLCGDDTWFKVGRSSTLRLTPDVLELFDLLYLAGCQFGVGRGAYEQMVQEDVEAGDIPKEEGEEDQCPKCKQYLTAGLLTC